MNLYINTETLEYPITETEILNRLQLSGKAIFDKNKLPDEYSRVFTSSFPIVKQYQKVTEIVPKLNEKGNYEQAFIIESIFVDFTDDNGIFHTKEEQLAATLSGIEDQRLNNIKNIIVREMQKRLDAFARAKQYDNISMLVLRAGYPGPFHEEGIYGAQLMDYTWKKYIDIFDQVKMGLRKHPETFSDIEYELPLLTWEQ